MNSVTGDTGVVSSVAMLWWECKGRLNYDGHFFEKHIQEVGICMWDNQRLSSKLR